MSTDYSSLEEGMKKVSTFESGQADILHKMLKHTFDFAGQIPEYVHVYFQIGNGFASAGFLFEIGGKVLETHTLGESEVELNFELTGDRQQWLYSHISQEMLSFISHCKTQDRPVPKEVWLTGDIKKDQTFSSSGFNWPDRNIPDLQDEIQRWKSELEDPSYKIMKDIMAMTEQAA